VGCGVSRPLGMPWSIPGSPCLLVLCGELSWCPSWSIPAGHPWHGVSRPTTQETETGPQGMKPGDTYTTTSWNIPDASPHMDAGLPVHVWGCRCHLVTLTSDDLSWYPSSSSCWVLGGFTACDRAAPSPSMRGMRAKPSQDPMSRGLAGSSAGTACVQANGGDAPVPHCRETLVEEGNNETLPVVGKGLGSRTSKIHKDIRLITDGEEKLTGKPLPESP
jgi:hypothetical protein